jgi:hypothetical protein
VAKKVPGTASVRGGVALEEDDAATEAPHAAIEAGGAAIEEGDAARTQQQLPIG